MTEPETISVELLLEEGYDLMPGGKHDGDAQIVAEDSDWAGDEQ